MVVVPVDQYQKLTVVRTPDDGCQHAKHVELSRKCVIPVVCLKLGKVMQSNTT